MKFCKYCGKQLQDDEVCNCRQNPQSNVAATIEAQPDTPQADSGTPGTPDATGTPGTPDASGTSGTSGASGTSGTSNAQAVMHRQLFRKLRAMSGTTVSRC